MKRFLSIVGYFIFCVLFGCGALLVALGYSYAGAIILLLNSVILWIYLNTLKIGE